MSNVPSPVRTHPFCNWLCAGVLPVAAVACLAPATLAETEPNIEIIARSTDPLFGGDDDTEARLENAYINNAGDVAFEVNLIDLAGGTDFDSDVVYRYASGAFIEELRSGPFGTGGSETLEDVRVQGLSNSGSLLTSADVLVNGSNDAVTLFLGNSGTVTELFREGDPRPGGGVFNRPAISLINAHDQVAFLTIPRSGFLPDAVIRADADGVETLASIGDGVPGKAGVTFEFFTGFVPIGNAGHVGFTAEITGTGITENVNNEGFYVADPAGNITQYVRIGAPAPTEPGSIIAGTGTRVPVNSDGDALLSLFYRDAGGNFTSGGLFLADGSSLDPILLSGDPAPGIDGRFITFSGVPSFNDRGDIAVLGNLTDDTAVRTRTGQALFVGDAEGLTSIVQTGDPLPGDQPGVFRFFGSGDDGEVGLNERGQIAFFASTSQLDGGEVDGFGLFFYDPELGIVTIATQDQPFAGDALQNMVYRDNAGAINDAASGLNDAGQLAFQYLLKNGETGIAVFSIPEPTAATLFAACLLGLLTRRDRRTA